MRKLVIVLVVVLLGFAAYWFAGARALEGGLAGWIEARRADGWVADYTDLSTRGFPTRFETRLSGLELADPDAGVVWATPAFTVMAESFRPNAFRAEWSTPQTLATPVERIEIASSRIDAGLEFVPGTRLEVRRIEADLAALALTSDLGWTARLETGHLSATETEGQAATYDLAFTAAGLVPSTGIRRRLDPARLLPDVIEGMTIDARVAFDAPWDRFAIEDARPQITAIDLRDLRATWGEVDLRAAGELSVDDRGRPSGRITVRATNWREMLAMARNMGALPEPLVPTIERALEVLAGLSGPEDTIEAPLGFQRGFITLGPIPLGRAPNLTLR